jgi:hypothetical protein
MNTKYKYLCYVRPGYEEQFRNVIRSANLENQTLFISDFKVLGKLDWVYYVNINDTCMDTLLSANYIEESVMRCRLLRSMPTDEAEMLLQSAYITFLNLIDMYEVKEVFGLCIDSYVGDALRLAINKRGGKYNGIVVSFIQGYFRLTELGEKITHRVVSDSEVEAVFQRILENKNRAHFLPKKKRNAIVRGAGELKGVIKDLLRLQYYRTLKRLKLEYNYHVKVNAMGLQGVPTVLNGYDCWKKNFEPLSGAVPRLYLPLQVSPEATIDYWSQSLEPIDYEEYIFRLIRQLPGIEFVIKENPSVYVRRSKGFYKKLHSFKNVKCVDVNIDSSFLIQNTEATITVTGSVGVEALIQGKPCVILGNPYYNYSESPFFLSADVEDLNENKLEDFFKKFNECKVSNCEKTRIDAQKSFISFVLSGLLKGDFRLPARSKSGRWVYDLNASITVGKELTKVFGGGS